MKGEVNKFLGISFLSILIVLGILLQFIDKGVLIYHWSTLGFKNLVGWHWATPLIGLGMVLCYFGVMILTPVKEHWYFWVVGAVWFLFELILIFSVANTYGWFI